MLRQQVCYQERLKKYDPETKVWSTVGGNPLPLGFNLSTSSSIAVAIAPDGTPFVAYRDQGDQTIPKLYIWIMKQSNGQIPLN